MGKYRQEFPAFGFMSNQQQGIVLFSKFIQYTR